MPKWYQKGFSCGGTGVLWFADKTPASRKLPDGRTIRMNEFKALPPSQGFMLRDLYTTFFGSKINDDIERYLFGTIDQFGCLAVRAFVSGDFERCRKHFLDFFQYIDAQKIRTPKGLAWLREEYIDLDQVALMEEMQRLRNLNCTIWAEGVREIVSAENSTVKFIVSDHPVTTYNSACPPDSNYCRDPYDPHVSLKGTQTIFPLGFNHCLILTNLEYASNPDTEDPLEKRTNPRYFAPSLARTDAFIRCRSLTDSEVEQINFIIKSRAKRYVAAHEKGWLFPENRVSAPWSDLNLVLRPPEKELHRFGGEIFVEYKDGSVHYQDAFGRTTSNHDHLKKKPPSGWVWPNKPCPCGSGRRYKECCRDIPINERPSFTELSVRERNIAFANIVCNILGLSQGKTWRDIRENLSNEQVKKIHEAFGFLWPIDTDIYSLLPVPNKKISRAIYSGIADPRMITKFATSLTLYFDEVIIINPFVNPAGIRPECSPVNIPHKYKQETLKNVFLILQLMPFIEAGYINLIPDPSVFNAHLREDVLDMAQKRLRDKDLDESDIGDMRELTFADTERVLHSMSRSEQRAIIQQKFPSMSEAKLIEILQHLEEKRLRDPLALLQEDMLFEEGQLIRLNLAPNFELGLLLAQLTGSAIVTDNKHRWKEIERAILDSNGARPEGRSKLVQMVESVDFLMNADPRLVFELRHTGKLKGIRRVFREMKVTIENEVGRDDPLMAERLCCRMQREYKTSIRQWKTFRVARTGKGHNPARSEFRAKFTCKMPAGGLTTNSVRRLLIASGSTKHRHSVGLAVYTTLSKSKSLE